MGRKKTLINKQNKKRLESCAFCECADYEILDVHRINEGADGGRYTSHNSLTVCANCHRKIHSGKIKTFRKHLSTGGYVLHCEIEGQEQFLKL